MTMSEQVNWGRILAISSGGGHWHQLMRLAPSLPPQRTIYASPLPKGTANPSGIAYHQIGDGNRDTPLRLGLILVHLLWLILRHRSAIILSTGAAPGCLAILIGRRLGARCLFIDSVANARELSMSARLAKRYGATVYSQWPDVAEREAVEYAGSVFAGLADMTPTETLQEQDRDQDRNQDRGAAA